MNESKETPEVFKDKIAPEDAPARLGAPSIHYKHKESPVLFSPKANVDDRTNRTLAVIRKYQRRQGELANAAETQPSSEEAQGRLDVARDNLGTATQALAQASVRDNLVGGVRSLFRKFTGQRTEAEYNADVVAATRERDEAQRNIAQKALDVEATNLYTKEYLERESDPKRIQELIDANTRGGPLEVGPGMYHALRQQGTRKNIIEFNRKKAAQEVAKEQQRNEDQKNILLHLNAFGIKDRKVDVSAHFYVNPTNPFHEGSDPVDPLYRLNPPVKIITGVDLSRACVDQVEYNQNDSLQAKKRSLGQRQWNSPPDWGKTFLRVDEGQNVIGKLDGAFQYRAAPNTRTALGWYIATHPALGRSKDFTTFDVGKAAQSIENLVREKNLKGDITDSYKLFSGEFTQTVHDVFSELGIPGNEATETLWQTATRTVTGKEDPWGGFNPTYPF